jgi:uncharacterized membrane protein HdeD (DUF308 family)
MSASMGSPAGTPAGAPTTARWGVILGGIVAILFGLVVLVWPAITLRALILVFGIFAVAAGVFAILAGVRAEDTRRRWLHITEGGVATLAGIVALAWPAITAAALLFVIAAWAIVTGIIEVAGAFRTRLAAMQEWLLLASGAISVIFGILLLVWPRLGLLALVWLIGIYAILYGVIHLVLAFTGGPVGGARRKAVA